MKRLLNSGIDTGERLCFNPLNTDAIHGLIEVSREAVAVNPSFDNHLMLAGAYQLQPDFEHARREYQECYKLNRNSPVLAQARRSFHYAVVSSSQASQPMLAESMQKIEEQLRNTPAMRSCSGFMEEAKSSKETEKVLFTPTRLPQP